MLLVNSIKQGKSIIAQKFFCGFSCAAPITAIVHQVDCMVGKLGREGRKIHRHIFAIASKIEDGIRAFIFFNGDDKVGTGNFEMKS